MHWPRASSHALTPLRARTRPHSRRRADLKIPCALAGDNRRPGPSSRAHAIALTVTSGRGLDCCASPTVCVVSRMVLCDAARCTDEQSQQGLTAKKRGDARPAVRVRERRAAQKRREGSARGGAPRKPHGKACSHRVKCRGRRALRPARASWPAARRGTRAARPRTRRSAAGRRSHARAWARHEGIK
jgi:hypothetical protein